MEYAETLDGVVNEPTQSGGDGFDLTADRILEVADAGRIDFGGGELEPAATEPVPTEKRNPDDDFRWWHLDAGQYLLEHNKSVASGAPRITVQSRTELLDRGGSHPTVAVDALPRLPLSVGARACC